MKVNPLYTNSTDIILITNCDGKVLYPHSTPYVISTVGVDDGLFFFPFRPLYIYVYLTVSQCKKTPVYFRLNLPICLLTLDPPKTLLRNLRFSFFFLCTRYGVEFVCFFCK